MSNKKIYTDSVSDAIGNNPVVDQYDVEYTANFYGTLQDAYMTGTMLRKSGPYAPLEVVTIGGRGSAFSNFDASSQPLPSDITPGSFEAITFPRMSDRLQPWSEKVGSTYRTTQHFDDKERFYDSCLPNLGEALAADGTQIRTKSSESTYLPTDFPNLALWCRADQEVYAQGAYMGPPILVPIVPTNGDRIVLWRDLSGNNRHFRVNPVQASSAPIWTTSDSEFNNQPSLKWDNVTPEIPLTSSYTPSTTNSALTTIIVYRVNERAPQNRPIHEKILSDDFGFYMGISGSNLWTTPVVPHVRSGVDTLFSLPPFSTILPSETSSSYRLISKNDLFIIHTSQLTTAYAEQFILGSPSGQASSSYSVIGGISGNLYVGNKLTSDQEVKVSEIIIYERKLDRHEFARIHSYLAGRYFNSSYYSEYMPWHLLLSASSFSGYSLQPHGNLETDSKGFVLMNCPTSGDLQFDDPSTNNSWTWSYPYENRYNPNKRLRDAYSDEVLGAYFASHVMTPATASQVTGLDSNPRKLQRSKRIKGIIPILPGKLSDSNLPAAFRNGYRLRPNDSSEDTFFLPDTEDYDSSYGYSLVVPSDINAVKPDSFPDGEYLSSSMYPADLTKFFFGFGDMNTMTFYDQSGAYDEVEYKEVFNCRKYYFGTGSYTGSYYSATGSHFATLPSSTFLNGQVSINFGPFPSLSTYLAPLPDAGWKITENTHYNGEYYFSSSVTTVFEPTQGVRWKRNGESSNSSKIIRSEIPGSVNGFYSSIVFDVTSSLPWKLSYDRAIVQSGSNSPNYFETVILAKPGHPSKVSFTSFNTPPVVRGTPHPSAVDALDRLDYFTSSVALETMERFVSDPLIPGNYRLAFRFHLVDTASTGSSGRAFLDNVAISTIEDKQIITKENSRTMGGNNYPEFRLLSVDDRVNPHSLEDSGSYTQKFYQSNVFAVSPIIRGWKYGLASGFPLHSKAVFRRNRYGQFRDMLEQRPFTKFIIDGEDAFRNAAVPAVGLKQDPDNPEIQIGRIETSPVSVSFVRQRFEVNDRSIGRIYNEFVSPYLTTSQNLSTEVTSSVPYSDGNALHRSEDSMPNLKTT